jgi:pimeloyl-ACP methyl ester carboxylesterase
MLKGHARFVVHRKPPSHYLEYVVAGKSPIILIPGIFGKWTFLQDLGDDISKKGHPVFIVSKLGYNLAGIPASSKIVRELIERYNLENVILIGHSKGGLIGKYLLLHKNEDERIKGLIAIATPFSGTRSVQRIPLSLYREVSPQSKLIQELKSHTEVNSRIVSIFPEFDNLVSSESGSWLDGAKNIALKTSGHHNILFTQQLRDVVGRSIVSF